MVVLLILAILLAIAIPTFLGVTKTANDRAAQSNLNTALVNAKSIFQTNGQSYALAGATGATSQTANNASMVTSLAAAGTSLSFTTGTVTGGLSPATVSVNVAQDGNGIILAEQAKGTNSCWYVIDNPVQEAAVGPYANVPTANLAAGTWYGKLASQTSCGAAVPTGVTYLSGGFPS
jgi:type II secretory pathway pseudopilin PulG